MVNLYDKVLRKFADALIATQLNNVDPSLNGGFLCRCCKNIHGRSIDAIYGLAVCYKRYKDEKYLKALISLFNYSDNVLCTDGGLYNDLQTEWRFTTTFHEIALVETLNSCEDILPTDLVSKIKERIAIHGKWLYENLDEKSAANINYCTTNALALLLAGQKLNKEEYIKQSEKLVKYAISHISKNNLFYGEWQPHDKKSPKGCLGIDIGYNLEESLPAMAKYALASKNKEVYDAVLKFGLGHLMFILPDGAIDNSFGDRNYKWTYYGSRTCDGILPLCVVLGKDDPRFIEAAYRNLELIDKCAPNGYLYGGPDYQKHGEQPCLHHTFEHINAVAFALDNYSEEFLSKPNVKLPSEDNQVVYLEEMNAYRLSFNDLLMDISDYDVNIPYNGHLCGGTVTLLYNRKTNKPYIVGSVGDYQLTEQTNMQVPLDRDHHRPLFPRMEKRVGKTVYSTGYYLESNLRVHGFAFNYKTGLMDRSGNKLNDNEYDVAGELGTNSFIMKITGKGEFEYILPLVNGELEVEVGKVTSEEDIFFLTPGFIAKEYRIKSVNGTITFIIK